ncbi:uncharacterized protein BDZ83DRAFT_783427 [Colletotrichum acutatum]|uniref:DUF6546 domain-containing protein n=1 Tax=Glomerella acutata TaxID=27357 RepID=A0AAD8UJS1_GLOAC|nr:uncharacterized protein BDZ83DRAFT_783427 [Colletotrichum acutatum]KAK1722529.1 hypothetical protein BDZ83DRAFT_783427 [Colletotrichum acutatum]
MDDPSRQDSSRLPKAFEKRRQQKQSDATAASSRAVSLEQAMIANLHLEERLEAESKGEPIEACLKRMLSTKSTISTASSFAKRQQASVGVAAKFREIGTGSIGKVFEHPGTTFAYKLSLTKQHDKLWNNYIMHKRSETAFNSLKFYPAWTGRNSQMFLVRHADYPGLLGRESRPVSRCIWISPQAETNSLYGKDLPSSEARPLLASVSAEWQTSFEKRNFKYLALTRLQDITMLEDFVGPRRQMYVSEIWLHVLLAPYTSGELCEEEDEEILHNNEILDEHLESLFRTLSKWQLGYGNEKNSGVHLHFSAEASDDYDNLFRSNDPLGELYYDLELAEVLGANKRIMGNLLDFENETSASSLTSPAEPGFPAVLRVPIVKEFSIRDELYRSLSAGAIRFLLLSLDNLETIKYTSWRGIDRRDRYQRDRANVALLESLPPTAKSVSSREARHDKFHGPFDEPGPSRDIARVAVLACFHLVSFSSLSVLDAMHFFNEVIQLSMPPMMEYLDRWSSLEAVALTSPFLNSKLDEAYTQGLLQQAAAAAMHLPNLKVMELWQTWKPAAILFRYEVSGHTVEVSYGASWDLKLHQDICDGWEVAKHHGNLFFDIQLKVLDIPASADIDAKLRVNSY